MPNWAAGYNTPALLFLSWSLISISPAVKSYACNSVFRYASNVWQTAYDQHAHPLTVKAPDGATMTFTYDPATQRISSIQNANGNTTSYTYDNEGNVLTRTDALGHVTTYTYDPMFSQTLSMTNPNGRRLLIPSTGTTIASARPIRSTESGSGLTIPTAMS